MDRNNTLHDADRLIADLRDHLARHDKRVAFLFGAGTSCSVRVSSPDDDASDMPLIPDVIGLTCLCEKAVKAEGTKFASAWESIWSGCKETNQSPNVEDVLSRLRMMVEAIGTLETLAGLSKTELTKLEELLRREIANTANPQIDGIVRSIPHRQFARWLIKVARQHPVEIFTVNYDILIELALEAERVPIFDGFVGSYQPFFHPDSLRHKEWAPGEKYTRLWKMHGSVTWRKELVDGRIRVVRGNPDLSGEMILPSIQKYDESRRQPYVALTDRLTRFLELDDALLVICGFGFGDQHINNLIFEALENRPRTHVYALQYVNPDQDSDLVTRGRQLHNLIVVGPDKGIIGGRHTRWGVPKGQADVLRMYEAKTSQEESEASDSTSDESQMRPVRLKIGNFTQFCHFLNSMTSS